MSLIRGGLPVALCALGEGGRHGHTDQVRRSVRRRESVAVRSTLLSSKRLLSACLEGSVSVPIGPNPWPFLKRNICQHCREQLRFVASRDGQEVVICPNCDSPVGVFR